MKYRAFQISAVHANGSAINGTVHVERTGKSYSFDFLADRTDDGAPLVRLYQAGTRPRVVPLNQLRDIRNAVREHFAKVPPPAAPVASDPVPASRFFRIREIEHPTGRILGAAGPVYFLTAFERNRNGILCAYGETEDARTSANADYVEFCDQSGVPVVAAPSDPVPADVPCYLAIAYKDGTETVLGVFRVAEHASAAEAEREAGKLCDRIRAAAPLASYGTRWKNGKGDAPAMVPQPAQQQQGRDAPHARGILKPGTIHRETRRGMARCDGPGIWQIGIYCVERDPADASTWHAKAVGPGTIGNGYVGSYPTLAAAYLSLTGEPMPGAASPGMVPQPCQPQQGQAAPSGFYAFQARGERAPRKPEPRFMGPQERDGITPKTIQAQTVQVRTRAEWYAFHHACRHLARQRMAAGRPGETMIPANICGRMHRLDVSRLSISHRIEGDRVRRVTNGSHIALKASMISARPRRALIAVELDYAAQCRHNAASEARRGNKHRRGLSIRAARASISEARSLATNFNRLPE